MRKSPSFKDLLICEDCGIAVERSGTTQKYCRLCRKERDKRTKKAWESRKYPERITREQFTSQSVNKMKCSACNSKAEAKWEGEPYCNKHWLRLYTNGTTERVGRKNTNMFEINEEGLVITTAKGVKIIADAENYGILCNRSWCIHNGYAVARIDKKVTRMHRFILSETLTANDVVDHINGNPLDNRKANLRICTSKENSRNARVGKNNKTGVTGVRKMKSGKYHARICVDRKEVNLGFYDKFEDAVKARKIGEKKHFGEYAKTSENQP